jgi:hypothetical protein
VPPRSTPSRTRPSRPASRPRAGRGAGPAATLAGRAPRPCLAQHRRMEPGWCDGCASGEQGRRKNRTQARIGVWWRMKQRIGALLVHPGPCRRSNRWIVRRVYVPHVDRGGPRDVGRPDLTASHSVGRRRSAPGTPRRTGPSRVPSNGGCARDGNDGPQTATTAKPHLFMLPEDPLGGLGPTFGARVHRWRAGPARRQRPVHGGAARLTAGRPSYPAHGRTGDLVPASAAEVTTGLP